MTTPIYTHRHRDRPIPKELSGVIPADPKPTIDPAPEADLGGQLVTSAQASPSEAKSYKVGYKKPPRSGCFKRGQKGNPKGRPKGSKNAILIFQEEANLLITVRDNGKTRKMSKIRVGIRKAMNKFVESGDMKGMMTLMKLLQSAAPFIEAAALKEEMAKEQELDDVIRIAQEFMRGLAEGCPPDFGMGENTAHLDDLEDEGEDK